MEDSFKLTNNKTGIKEFNYFNDKSHDRIFYI